MAEDWMKLYRLQDGRQVLAALGFDEYDEDADTPVIRLTWRYGGCVVTLSITFEDIEDRDSVFETLTEEQVAGFAGGTQ